MNAAYIENGEKMLADLNRKERRAFWIKLGIAVLLVLFLLALIAEAVYVDPAIAAMQSV